MLNSVDIAHIIGTNLFSWRINSQRRSGEAIFTLPIRVANEACSAVFQTRDEWIFRIFYKVNDIHSLLFFLFCL